MKATLQGYKTIDRRAIPIGTQQFITLDLTLEVGTIEESITVTGQSPIIETSNASQGTVLDSEALQTLPSPGRAAFLIGASVPTVVPSGDAQFNRQQDQTNASLLSLGGGTRRGNNYTLDGVPITDLTNRAVANPTIESLEDVKVQVHTYDAEMGRTGGGVFNTTLKSGTNTWRGTAFFQTRPVWGAANNYFSQKALENCRAGDTNCVNLNRKQDTKWYTPGAGFGGPIKKDRTFFWFATEDYHNISTRNSPGIVLPTAAERRGDFSQTRSGNAPVIIYDPLTRQPFPGNLIPANRINPIAAKISELRAAAATGCCRRRVELQRAGGAQRQVPAAVQRQGRAQADGQGVADRLLSVQPHRRAVRELHRRSGRPEPVHRHRRLHPEAAAADPGAEQHLGLERQLGGGAAIRLDAVPGQSLAVDRLRSGTARLRVELPGPDRSDRRAEVPDHRLP